jgi:ABC-type uncharacterized transport system fused permease/ATPase subunit
MITKYKEKPKIVILDELSDLDRSMTKYIVEMINKSQAALIEIIL